MYTQTTGDITVFIDPEYLEDQSFPENHDYVWAYHVRIENNGKEPVQLMMRHWKIIDGFGRTQEVKGAGVIGEQPKLAPGDYFQYSSGTPLKTPSGIMTGSYLMESETGENFEVAIPAFSLDSPISSRHIN